MTETLEQVLDRPVGLWQRGGGPCDDVAVSSRARLARNLRDLVYPPKMDAADAKLLFDRVQAAGRQVPERLGSFAFDPLSGVPGIGRQILVEKHLVSPQLAREARGAILLRPDERLSAMVYEEDHLRIQALFAGLQPDAAWRLASQFDDALEADLSWAFSERLGYLSTCPTNVGTALRASVMLHLPGLCWTGRIAVLLTGLAKVGLVARGLYGEGSSAAGDLFQVSNQTSLGPSEEDLVAHLTAAVREIVTHERSAREALWNESRHAVEDRVWRAYGILTHARVLPSVEALKLLSEVRLGAMLRVLPSLAADRWTELLVLSRPGFLQRHAGAAPPERRDVTRATILRQRLQAVLGESVCHVDGEDRARLGGQVGGRGGEVSTPP